MTATTRERMIETAARLLQHRGYHGISLNEILTEANAPRGSLYFHFPGGKDQLVLEATRSTVALTTEFLRTKLSSSKSPATAVRAFIEETARMMEASDYTFGCPVAPVILDGAEGVAELEQVCRQAFEEWVGLIRDALVAAGMAPARADTLALMIEASHEGSFLICRAYRDTAPLMKVARELETVIHTALSEAAAR